MSLYGEGEGKDYKMLICGLYWIWGNNDTTMDINRHAFSKWGSYLVHLSSTVHIEFEHMCVIE